MRPSPPPEKGRPGLVVLLDVCAAHDVECAPERSCERPSISALDRGHHFLGRCGHALVALGFFIHGAISSRHQERRKSWLLLLAVHHRHGYTASVFDSAILMYITLPDAGSVATSAPEPPLAAQVVKVIVLVVFTVSAALW